MAAHGVGVAQAKPACKHTIATRKCYQYNILINLNIIFNQVLVNLVTFCDFAELFRPICDNGFGWCNAYNTCTLTTVLM